MKRPLATGLFARRNDKSDATPKSFAVLHLSQCGGYKSGDSSFHIARTSTEQFSVSNISRKRIHLPLFCAEWHDVDMSREAKRLLRSGAGYFCN